VTAAKSISTRTGMKRGDPEVDSKPLYKDSSFLIY